ncbi:hypothetical protein ACSBR2_018944 [Camellia fascicularis]
MDRSDSAQPISVVLDGTNYLLLSQAMSAFFKGRQLWRVITGELTKPIQAADQTKTKFLDRLDAWNGKKLSYYYLVSEHLYHFNSSPIWAISN